MAGGVGVGNKRAGIGRNVVKDDGYFCLLALALFVYSEGFGGVPVGYIYLGARNIK